MRSIGMPELLVIMGVAIFLFGPKKIPEMMKGIGDGIRHFKHAVREGEEAKKEAEKA